MHVFRNRQELSFKLSFCKREGMPHVEPMFRPSGAQHVMIFLLRIDHPDESEKREYQIKVDELYHPDSNMAKTCICDMRSQLLKRPVEEVRRIG